MMKLRSNLVCTMMSLLMVFFLAAAAQGAHPWTDEPGNNKWGNSTPEDGPATAVDATRSQSVAGEFSQLGFISAVLYDISAALVDYVYGHQVEVVKTNQLTSSASSSK